jgi:putative copper resistance protein D
MLLFGGSSMRGILRGDGYGWTAPLDARLFRLLSSTALIALLTAVGWLLLETASMGDKWGAAIRIGTVHTVLTDTAFGRLWLGRLPIALLACLAAWLWKRSSFPLVLLSAVLLASLALTGHAVMDTGWLSLMHPLNQALHLLAAGFWLGGLVPLGLILAEATRGSADRSIAHHALRRSIAHHALRRFSNLAMIAVLLVLVSGTFNASLLVGTPSALISTFYGRALLVKLLFVGAMVALALVNRFFLLPAVALRNDAALRRLERNVVLETVVGALVLAVASTLGNLPPATM